LTLVRVLIVDDSESWRRRISTMLQQRPELQVVGEASDGLEAIQKCEGLRPDLVLLDIGLPKLNGIEAACRICAIVPGSTILFVSENRCPTIVQEALRTAACTRGYVLKSDVVDDLLPAVGAVMRQEQFISGRFAVSNVSDSSDT